DPNINNNVYSLALNGATVYVGGNFTTVDGGTARASAAAFTTGSQVATAWNPNFNGFSNSVRSIAFDGANVLVAGTMSKSAGGNTFNDFVAVNNTTGAAVYGYNEVDGNSATAGPLASIGRTVAVSGTSMFVGGAFEDVGLW